MSASADRALLMLQLLIQKSGKTLPGWSNVRSVATSLAGVVTGKEIPDLPAEEQSEVAEPTTEFSEILKTFEATLDSLKTESDAQKVEEALLEPIAKVQAFLLDPSNEECKKVQADAVSFLQACLSGLTSYAAAFASPLSAPVANKAFGALAAYGITSAGVAIMTQTQTFLAPLALSGVTTTFTLPFGVYNKILGSGAAFCGSDYNPVTVSEEEAKSYPAEIEITPAQYMTLVEESAREAGRGNLRKFKDVKLGEVLQLTTQAFEYLKNEKDSNAGCFQTMPWVYPEEKIAGLQKGSIPETMALPQLARNCVKLGVGLCAMNMLITKADANDVDKLHDLLIDILTNTPASIPAEEWDEHWTAWTSYTEYLGVKFCGGTPAISRARIAQAMLEVVENKSSRREEAMEACGILDGLMIEVDEDQMNPEEKELRTRVVDSVNECRQRDW